MVGDHICPIRIICLCPHLLFLPSCSATPHYHQPLPLLSVFLSSVLISSLKRPSCSCPASHLSVHLSSPWLLHSQCVMLSWKLGSRLKPYLTRWRWQCRGKPFFVFFWLYYFSSRKYIFTIFTVEWSYTYTYIHKHV